MIEGDPVGDDEGGRAPRVEATFRVSYASVDQLLVAYSSDLSKGGMFLSTDQFLPVNAVIRINLELGEGSAEIPVICRVVYVRDPAAARAVGKPAGMGIEFLDMTAECLALIEAYIAERIGQRRGRRRRAAGAAAAEHHDRRRRSWLPHAGGAAVPHARRLRARRARRVRGAGAVPQGDARRHRLGRAHAAARWLAAFRMCRARPTLSSVPFLFLTTLAGEQERLRGYQLGVDDYVHKPFRGKELQARVDRVVARAQRGAHALAEKKTLRGDLAQVALPSVLGFLELERKTGELLVIGAKQAHLFLREGRLLRVEVDGLVADAASIEVVYDLLGWRTGQFEFAAHEVPGEDLYDTTITALLLDHARFSDENER